MFELVSVPPDTNVLKSKLCFAIKKQHDLKKFKYKMRFVAARYAQEFGVDFNEVFAPTLSLDFMRMLLVISLT